MAARAPRARALKNAQRAHDEPANILEITARSISSMPQDTARGSRVGIVPFILCLPARKRVVIFLQSPFEHESF